MTNLFTAWSPALPNVNEATNVTVGIGLYFTSAGTVSAIRFYAPTTVGAGTYEGTLWQITADDSPAETGTATLLGSVSFGALTPGAWNTATLSSPISVSANTAYVVAVRTSEGRYTATGGFFNSSGLTNGNIVAWQTGTNPTGIGTLDNGKFITNITGYPNKTFNGNGYGVDVDYTVAGSSVNGAASQTTTLAGTATAAVDRNASASQTTTLAGTATANVDRNAGAAQTTAFTGTAAATVRPGGSATQQIGLDGSATAKVVHNAQAAGSLSLAGTAAPEPDAPPPRQGGGWGSLLTIAKYNLEQARLQRTQVITECPVHAYPLDPGRTAGTLHCTFGGELFDLHGNRVWS